MSFISVQLWYLGYIFSKIILEFASLTDASKGTFLVVRWLRVVQETVPALCGNQVHALALITVLYSKQQN